MKHHPSRFLALASMTLFLGLTGCGPDPAPVSVPPDRDLAPAITVDPPDPPPPDSAGAQAADRNGAQPYLVGGALGGPDAPADPEGLTPQEAANLVFTEGLEYADGTVQVPTWVRCVAATDHRGATAGHYTAFQCDIEVPDVYPYVISLTIGSSGAARFTFLRYAT
jgi:hypothetical protein